MIQEFFKGSIGPVAAGGFVGLLSLFNMAGRFFWASTSDYIGRKPTYFIFFTLGAALYFVLPMTGANHLNSVALFVGIAVVLLSMYGGGFATIPAYLRDLFGTYHVERNSRPLVDGLVGGRGSWTRTRELHAGISNRARGR